MVARINSAKSIAKALNYNEQKLKQGKAECLRAFNFIKDTDRLSFYDKLRHFERLTSLNERTVTHCLHISLNFDPSERLSNTQMEEIAKKYMEKIGFENQPYLVYRHHDAGHPHIHIVSTNIQRDGRRISLHNLGRNQSEKARRAIEQEFGLVKAECRKLVESLKLKPLNAQKLNYGKSETKRALSNILGVVVNQYKYTSLAELNAALKLYNVTADRGEEGSRLQKFKGLHYRVLDENGSKTGVPIKASSIYFKPTLQFLEKKFAENKSMRMDLKQHLKTSIDWILAKKALPMADLIKSLEKERISTVLRQNKEGFVFGITFVDHQTKSVFNGSDLGKQYTAAALQKRCEQKECSEDKQVEKREQKQRVETDTKSKIVDTYNDYQNEEKTTPQNIPKILEDLLTPEQANPYLPFQLRKGKRKRKRQSQSKNT